MSSVWVYLNENLGGLGGHANRNHSFQMINIPARYWRAAIGLARAKSISLSERGFNEQFCYSNHYKLGVWISRTLEDRQGRLRGKVVPPEVAQCGIRKRG